MNNRTKYDAAISSGLAIMACHKDLYRPIGQQQKTKLNLKIARYNQSGFNSTIIK
jgi:hypothetical protein